MSADVASEPSKGLRRLAIVGVAGVCVLSTSAAAIAHFTRPNVKPRERSDAGAARAEDTREETEAARDRELSELRQRLARLEVSERADQELTEAPAAVTSEGQPQPSPPESPEEMQRHVLRTMEEMDGRFASQGIRSDWAVTKEQELRTTVTALGQEQGGRVRSLDCRESMCRMEIEHDDAKQAHAFLDEAGFRTGLGNARSTRLRPKLDEERYFYYIEPRKPSKLTSR